LIWRANGTAIGWGGYWVDQCDDLDGDIFAHWSNLRAIQYRAEGTSTPEGETFVQVAAGGGHSIGLVKD